MSILTHPLRRAVRGGRLETRTRRYLITFTLGLLVIWGVSISYLMFAPRSYSSQFVFVLPGTGAGSSINLERLGQATTTSNSPFSSPDLSPTENYKKLLLSEKVQEIAAQALGEPPDTIPLPKVDLTGQTKLIEVKTYGPTPLQARARAEALQAAFLGMLDTLRNDEFAGRDAAYRTMLEGYKVRLGAARQELINHQARTGLVSAEQYGTMVSAVEKLHEQFRDTQARLAQARAGTTELSRLLGITVELAANAMVLRADPFFQALLEQSAKQDAELATLNGTRGTTNPRVVDLQAEHASTSARLVARGTQLTGLDRADLLKLRDLSVHDERARLFERLVANEADADALAGMEASLTAQIDTEHERVMALGTEVARLDDLKQDVQVAETVFSSALARMDTSKADYFASYPMAQTLEQPTLPARPASPRRLFALGGGMAGSIFLLLGMVLTWLRVGLLQRMLKNDSSSPPWSEPGRGT
jgi:uncharacterized protein involved in exopolysaccharide biosynthesis